MAKLCAQAANFSVRIGSLMVLGRLLEPRDFGLVGMVSAVIGVLNLFRDFGLSTATVQRDNVTDEQLTTLFWINMLIGSVLGVLAIAAAPLVVMFYHEPRLLWVTIALASSFVLNAAGVQHSAILQRQMRFTALGVIDTVALIVSTLAGIGMAFAGYGYWALVYMTIASPAVATACVWAITRWKPGVPRERSGIRSMMRFGGTITLNGLVVYIAYNAEKVLLGRMWGADALGIYGRAYQLISVPTENLNSAAGTVAFAALSRLQNDAARFRRYFLKGYSLVLAVTIPVTLVCALLSNDLIVVLLGAKWKESAVIFRLLAPTILIFAMINPLAWVMFAFGLVGRSLKIAMVLAPLVMLGYIMGLPYGPRGVAFGYSAVMALWAIPHIAWCVHGTPVSFKDIAVTVGRPLLAGLVAAAVLLGVQSLYGSVMNPLQRVVCGVTLLFAVYCVILLFVMGQFRFYVDLLLTFVKGQPARGNPAVAV